MILKSLSRSALLFLAAEGAGGGGGEPAAETPPAGGEKLSLAEQFRAAVASKAALQRKIDGLEIDVAEAGKTIERLTTENAGLVTERDGLKDQITALTTECNQLKGEVATLKANAKTAEDRAAEIVAAAGFPATNLPGQEEKLEATDDAAVYEEYKSLTGGERTAYFRKHKAALMRYADKMEAQAN